MNIPTAPALVTCVVVGKCRSNTLKVKTKIKGLLVGKGKFEKQTRSMHDKQFNYITVITQKAAAAVANILSRACI